MRCRAGRNPTEGGRHKLCRSNDIGTACSPAEARYYRTARRERSADMDPPHTSPRPAGCRAAQTSATAAGASASADDGTSADDGASAASGYRTAGHGATAPTAGCSTATTATCSTTAACSSAAPAAAATALGYSLVKQAFWGNFPVEDIEGRQADVGELLVVQRKDGKGCGNLRRHIRSRRRGRCAADDRQRRAGCSQER